MKRVLPIFLILAVFTMISACGPGPDPDPTPAELQTIKLAGENGTKTWTVSDVLFDGIEDRTADWTGFTLTLTSSETASNGYTTTGGLSGGPWPSSGTWEFGGTADNPNINLVVRDDALEIAINASDNQLTMTFTFDNTIHNSGRTEVVNGEYRFTFTN